MPEVTVPEVQPGGDDAAEVTPPEPAAAEDKTYKTQAEVDAVVEARLARERKKFADYEELKEKAAKYEESEAAKLSELEREKAAREAAEADRDAAREALREREIRSAIAEAAREAGVKNINLLSLAVDRTVVTMGDDGQVIGAAEAVAAAVAENPELVGAKGIGGKPDQGARGGGPHAITQEQFDALPAEERFELIKGRKVNHLL